MSFGDITRINTNVQAMQSYSTLQGTNNELGVRRQRLSTGSQLNRAEDDSAGYSIAKKLESRVRGQGQALANIGDAKGMLTVAEGGLSSTMDILQTMKEKAVQAGNDTLGPKERTAIKSQLDALSAEINDIAGNTDFNGKDLLSGDFDAGNASGSALSFQVGADQGDTFEVNIGASSSGALGVATASIDVSNASAAGGTLASIDAAINSVSDNIASLGDSQTRLSFKQENLSTAKTNYEASRSRIEDADFAKEQMQIAKLQILQQTGNASLAQANASSQSVLQLL